MNTFNYFFWSIVICIAGLGALFYGMLEINNTKEADILYEAEHGFPPKTSRKSKGRTTIYGLCAAIGVVMQFIPLLF